jgi:hypothetical protein
VGGSHGVRVYRLVGVEADGYEVVRFTGSTVATQVTGVAVDGEHLGSRPAVRAAYAMP